MIRIVVDSSADFTQEELLEKGIELVPLSITLNDAVYQDGVSITRNELYEWLLADSNHFPKTSQPSPQEFLNVFDDAAECGDEVVCILLSSSLSGTCQAAFLAKSMADYDNIHIVDSLTATHMIRILALHADRMRRNGSNASQIVTALEELKSKTRVFAALDTLEYLQRGGRLSKAAAAVGTLANLKPIITVSEGGTVEVIQKCMGRNKTVSFLMNKLQELNIDTEFPLYSVYTYGTENSEFFEKKLTDAGYRIAERVQVGATIGCHIGPGVYGFIYVEK